MAYSIEDLRTAREKQGRPKSLKGEAFKMLINTAKPPIRGTFLITADLPGQLGLNRIDGTEEEAGRQFFVPSGTIKVEGFIPNPQSIKYPALPAAQVWLQPAT